MRGTKTDSSKSPGATSEALPDLVYAGGHLDRSAVQRCDAGWIAERLDRDDACLLPIWRTRNLLRKRDDLSHQPTARFCVGASARRVAALGAEIVFLGLEGARPYFAADVSALEEESASELVEEGEFLDLRQVGPLLPRPEAALLAYARGICHWHRRHLYCGRCGAPTRAGLGGHERHCKNPRCAAKSHPRIDPAVIMLVETEPADGAPGRCLLGNHARLPPGTYTTLAGFVEPGEGLEEAVAREVAEEAGIEVDSVTYCASQPWPFPGSIMLGFRARASTTAISIDDKELTAAHWFSAAEVAGFGEWGDDSAFRLPRKDSIARFLVDSWLADRAAAGEV